MRLFRYLYDQLRDMEWRAYNKRKLHRLRNREFTIIASNCKELS